MAQLELVKYSPTNLHPVASDIVVLAVKFSDLREIFLGFLKGRLRPIEAI